MTSPVVLEHQFQGVDTSIHSDTSVDAAPSSALSVALAHSTRTSRENGIGPWVDSAASMPIVRGESDVVALHLLDGSCLGGGEREEQLFQAVCVGLAQLGSAPEVHRRNPVN